MDESYFNDVREITTEGPENMEWDLLWEEEKLTTLYNQYIDIMIKLKEEGTDLQAFWISFLEMVEILLSTIFAIRSGKWELVIECFRKIVPYTFAYDNINCARYLTGMLADMLNLIIGMIYSPI